MKILKWMTGCLLVLAGFSAGLAQAASPVEITLTTEKPAYTDAEPVGVSIRVRNISGADAYVTRGFFEGDFHLDLDLNGPGGNIRPLSTVGSPEPLGPFSLVDSEGVQRNTAVSCERIVPYDPVTGDGETFRVVDLKNYYPITETGAYTATVKTNFDVYVDFVEREDTGEIFCFTDDPEREEFNPLESNPISFAIEPLVAPVEAQVNVTATLMNIGPGKKPPVTKTPINRLRIELYALAEIPDDLKPVNHKKYEQVSNSLLVDPVQVRFTASDGTAAFGPLEQADYVLIGIFQDSTETRFVGAKIAADDPNWSGQIHKKLKVMILQNGDKVMMGKTRRLTGSELLITQPEYVEWDSTEEYYPFVFEAVGDWGVTTTLEPPEGFVADEQVLSTSVDNEIEAVQFTVTDVGSDWVETGVTFDIKHKKKKIKIKDKIGIKLEKKFAKKKNLGIYGDTEDPGDFKGGKKVKDTDGDKTKSKGKM